MRYVSTQADRDVTPPDKLRLGEIIRVEAGQRFYQWDGTKWLLVSKIMGDGDPFPDRPWLHFKGRTISVGDNPANQSLEVTVIDEVPAGGTTGQVLAKTGNGSYEIGWVDP